MKRVGVVVPTLFTRNDYLLQSLEAIQKAGDPYVILMGPDVEVNSKNFAGLFDQIVEEPSTGTLSVKLNFALNALPEDVYLITWIGDDDLLAEGSLRYLEQQFINEPELLLIYGACNYIDSHGNKIGENKSHPWALDLAKFGPFLAPQPGSLFLRQAFEEIGGLDSKLKLAFDFDLFLRLSKLGRIKHVNKTLASFRWHSGSLSVSQRRMSVKEASIVRKKHSHFWLRPLMVITNPMIEIATYLAGLVLDLLLAKKSSA